MRIPRPHRFGTRCARLMAGLLVAVPLTVVSAAVTAVGTASPAFASDGTLTQQSPVSGVVVGGTAQSDQLQVAGATGTVTYTQTAGDSVTVSSSGAVSAADSLAAGTYTASGTDADTDGDTGTWTYTLTVLQPAPTGFTDQVVSVYQSIYSVAQDLGSTSAMQTVAQYQQQVAQLDPVQQAVLYNATQQSPDWSQIPDILQTVVADIGADPAPSADPADPPASGTSTGGDPPVAPYQPASCPTGPTDQAVFAVQITLDDTAAAYDAASAAEIELSGGLQGDLDLSAPAALASIILAGVAGVLSVAHDTLAYQQELASDCDSANQDGYIANIDNTTTQTYALLTTVSSVVAQVQSTDDATQQDVQDVQSSLSSLQADFDSTIASDTQVVQATVGDDNQGLTSQLQTDLQGVQQDLSAIQSDETTLSQSVGQVNSGTTAIQTALSGDLTQLITEIDTQAQSITTLATQDNQQVLNALQTGFSAQQDNFNAILTLQIEQALGTWGNYLPPVQFMLPAAQGGYLNSTPVGVQEVVTTAISELAAAGVNVKSQATRELAAANSALAAGDYETAYYDYAAAYESLP